MNHGIDIHTHIVPEQFPAYTGSARDVPWPSMAHDNCGHATVVISGKNYRTVPSTCWDCSARTQGMDAQRIARQVLSPMPELLSYWLPLDAGKQICRHLNETIAAMIAREPSRFSGLGAVPLQDIDAAIAELEFIMRSLKLSGVEIATHINGVSIGDPKFDPFFTAVESLGAAVFVHGLRPAGKDRLVGPPALEQVVAFPGDVALAAASLITGGMLERHPRLRIALSHGGGAMALVLPRLEHGWKTAKPIHDSIPRAPSEYARQLYADTLVYDPHALRAVIRTFGEDKVMIGTDFPFVIADQDPHGSVDAIAPSNELALALREGNARRFLGL
jgi:aminocarboxymuconate-semialdehyde decarboxylase